MEMETMHPEDLEKSSLISSKEESAARARAAYRAELATKRAIILAVLILPMLLVIVLWHLFDSNARLGAKHHSHTPLAVVTAP